MSDVYYEVEYIRINDELDDWTLWDYFVLFEDAMKEKREEELETNQYKYRIVKVTKDVVSESEEINLPSKRIITI